MEKDKLYLGDCLEVMKDIADKSIDAIVTDLPFGVLQAKNPTAQWDKIIPFEPMWKQYERYTEQILYAKVRVYPYALQTSST